MHNEALWRKKEKLNLIGSEVTIAGQTIKLRYFYHFHYRHRYLHRYFHRHRHHHCCRHRRYHYHCHYHCHYHYYYHPKITVIFKNISFWGGGEEREGRGEVFRAFIFKPLNDSSSG